jgi:hypothetical protein
MYGASEKDKAFGLFGVQERQRCICEGVEYGSRYIRNLLYKSYPATMEQIMFILIQYFSRSATQCVTRLNYIQLHHAPRLTLVLINVIFLPFFFLPPACFFGASSAPSPNDIACT